MKNLNAIFSSDPSNALNFFASHKSHSHHNYYHQAKMNTLDQQSEEASEGCQPGTLKGKLSQLIDYFPFPPEVKRL